MIKTLNPYSDAAVTGKTAEIMSKYRPIAPKPEGSSDETSSKISQSPYLRNVWPQMQARATRTRKRGRVNSILPPSFKKRRSTGHQFGFGFSNPSYLTSQTKTLSLRRGPPPPPQLQFQFQTPVTTIDTSSIVTLPLLKSCNPTVPVNVTVNRAATSSNLSLAEIDLNGEDEIPEEKDLIKQLQRPIITNVIKPQLIRPVNSIITVNYINKVTNSNSSQNYKTPDEIEQEMESEHLPAVVSDSRNNVRLANSSYKEMVGQPECSWLDGIGFGSCKRINGEVMLINFNNSNSKVPYSNGFTCWVRIEWGNYDGEKKSVNAFCDVVRLCCKDKDYVFTWRFHTQTRDSSNSEFNNTINIA